MIENVKFVKVNWDPEVYNYDVNITNAIATNIHTAIYSLPIYTSDQVEKNPERYMMLYAISEVLAAGELTSFRIKDTCSMWHCKSPPMKCYRDAVK